MKVLASTPRTISAIRKADALPTVIPGGKMKKGNIQGIGGFDYSGPFALEVEDTTHITLRGNNTSVPARSIDSYLLVDSGTYCYEMHVPETSIEALYNKSYICVDWWWDTVNSEWIYVALASAYLVPTLAEYVGYPADRERISRRILGKVKWGYDENNDPIVGGITQWLQGIIYVSARTY